MALYGDYTERLLGREEVCAILAEEFSRAKEVYRPEEFSRPETMAVALGALEARIVQKIKDTAKKDWTPSDEVCFVGDK